MDESAPQNDTCLYKCHSEERHQLSNVIHARKSDEESREALVTLFCACGGDRKPRITRMNTKGIEKLPECERQ
jgi:hypothetical protein